MCDDADVNIAHDILKEDVQTMHRVLSMKSSQPLQRKFLLVPIDVVTVSTVGIVVVSRYGSIVGRNA